MGLMLPSPNKLLWPGARRRAGFNPAHIAAGGSAIRYSAVPQGATMTNLLTGKAASATGTITAALTSVGPVVTNNTASSYLSTPGINETLSAVTIGVIYIPGASVAAFSFIFNNDGNTVVAANATGLLIQTGFSLKLSVAGNQLTPASMPTLVSGVPYFIATSYNGTTLNFVIVNLLTGQTYVLSTASTHTIGTTTAAQYNIGGASSASTPMDGQLAAVMYSAAYLSANQLAAWAADPWSFWYPSSQLERLPLGGRAPVANTQALSWATASALAATKSVSKAVSWTTASVLTATKVISKTAAIAAASTLTATKAVGKAVAIATSSTVSFATSLTHLLTLLVSTSSAVSVVKQASKVLSWTTASAVSVIASKGKQAAITIATTSAVSAVRRAGKVLSWTTTSAAVATAMKVRLVAVAIATTTALRIVKQASKIIGAGGIRVTMGGDTRTTMAGDIRVTQNAMVTSNTLAARKRVNKFLSGITSSTASFLRSHVHPVRVAIVTASAVVIRALSSVVGAVFTRAIAITTRSTLVPRKGVGKVQSRTTASALRMARRTGKQIPVSTSSVFSAVKRVGKRLAFVTHGAFSVVKQVRKRVLIVTHGALTVAKHIVRFATVIIATTETVAVAFNTSGFHPTKAINIATSSAVTVLRGLFRMRLVLASTASAVAVGTAATLSKTILIATASVLSVATASALNLILTIGTSSSSAVVKSVTNTIGAATSSSLTLALKLAYGVVVLIASTSSVALSTIASIAARLGQMLVGRWARMVMSGQVSRMAVSAQVSQLELTGMSTHQNGIFHLGETWIINGLCRDTTGAPLDLTNATVQLRIVTVDPNAIILDLSTPSTGSILSPATAGAYVFEIAPAQQAAMTLTAYHYEVRAELGDGRFSVQNTGVIEVRPSKFVNFPV